MMLTRLLNNLQIIIQEKLEKLINYLGTSWIFKTLCFPLKLKIFIKLKKRILSSVVLLVIKAR